MGADCGGYFGLHRGQVIVFVHHSDIDIDGAGAAVAAVGTLSLPKRMSGGMCQHGGIVVLFIGGSLIGHSLLHMFRDVIYRHHRCHGGPGEAVVDELHRREGHTEGGALGVEQPLSCAGLHHRQTHVILLAQYVQLHPPGVDTTQGRRGFETVGSSEVAVLRAECCCVRLPLSFPLEKIFAKNVSHGETHLAEIMSDSGRIIWAYRHGCIE